MKIRPANEQDLVELANWFLTEKEAKNWGGPSIHFPISPKQLKIDIEWDIADSYGLTEKDGKLIGFGQAFNKFGFRHLGRIVVSPEMRGKKMGYKLMTSLFESTGIEGVSFSLFVYENNVSAINLYKSLGFVVQGYPDGQPEIKGCIFMVKKAYPGR